LTVDKRRLHESEHAADVEEIGLDLGECGFS
jgi:hypothetical protein